MAEETRGSAVAGDNCCGCSVPVRMRERWGLRMCIRVYLVFGCGSLLRGCSLRVRLYGSGANAEEGFCVLSILV